MRFLESSECHRPRCGLLVEPWAARAAAVNRLHNHSHHLDSELKAFSTHTAGKRDIRQNQVAHDALFHEFILAASGNAVILNAYQHTHCHLHIFRLYPADIDGTITIDEHRRVWEAIRDCDPEAAEEVLLQHLKRAFQRFAVAFQDADPTGLGGEFSPRLILENPADERGRVSGWCSRRRW
jgi:DNA-binding GntR family transcriptional regulator